MSGKKILAVNNHLENFYKRVAPIIREACTTIMRAIDTTMVKAYWDIGCCLVEKEQQGISRANYGKLLIQYLSQRLTKEFGHGFGITTLEDIRKFYLTYRIDKDSEKSHAVRGELPQFYPNLS